MSAFADGVNRVVADKYRLLDLLGRGGMGSVYRAEHLTLQSYVAVKLVEPTILAHPEAMARFLREAQAAAALRSPHVVQILDYGVDGEQPFIVMELLEGESLANRLTRLGKLSAKSTAEVLSQVCRAVARAHERGIVHRDLKPDNIFLTANDDSEIAKVLDFGIAKNTIPGSHGMTQTGAVLGTPYYMSPEQAEGARDVDARSDLWALSVITYECLLGKRPFDEESIGALVLAICTRPLPIPSQHGSVPNGFDAWFARGVSRDRTRRFETARELARTLRQVCGITESDQNTLLSASTPDPFVNGANTPAALGNLGGTSSAVSLVRPFDDEPLTPPMHRLSPVVKALVGGTLVLLVAATAFSRFVGRTSSESVTAEHPPSVATPPSEIPSTAASTASEIPSTVAASVSRATPPTPPLAAPPLAAPPLRSRTTVPKRDVTATTQTPKNRSETPKSTNGSTASPPLRRPTTPVDLGI